MEKEIKKYVEVQLRRIFGWSAPYKECQTRAKLTLNCYGCDGCGTVIYKIHSKASEEELLDAQEYFKQVGLDVIPAKLHVDHIEPVKPIEGFKDDIDWAKNIILRTLCSIDNLQYLCDTCHYIKTQIENKERKDYKNE